MSKRVIAFDTETVQIGPGQVTPDLVCVTAATYLELGGKIGETKTSLRSVADNDILEMLEWIFEDEENVTLVGHNVAFDLAVINRAFPQLRSKIFKALADERVTDTRIREKLINLSTHGNLDMIEAPDGSTRPIKYSLATLGGKYLGTDRSDEKDGDDIWRLHYEELIDFESQHFPEEAAEYAVQDALDTLEVYKEQEAFKLEHRASTETEYLHTAASFGLQLMTERGMAIDPEKVAEIEEMLEQELDESKMRKIVSSGILRPAQPPREYKNQPGKFTKGKPASVDKKALTEHLVKTAAEVGYAVPLTPTGAYSTSKEVLQELAPHDEVLAEFQHRQNLQKLVTTELPRLKWEGNVAERVHFNFDPLKSTGRSSSFASSLYPSANGQNLDPRIRGCYTASPGMVLVSCDYSSLELVTLAQKTFDLFGKSTLRELINDGGDPHAFLGSQLAYHLDNTFRQICIDVEATSKREIYEAFLECKSSESEEVREFFRHYRTFAKPVGLGYPGGLGPETFCKLAKTMYGIVVDEEMAIQLREIWLDTYPEMSLYFDWINSSCVDQRNEELYCYSTPLGMIRRGATYCAAANGAALQSPAAEGTKIAIFDIARRCYDEDGDMHGCYPVAFIHDELMVEIPEDDHMHENALKIQETMVRSMEVVIPDVRVQAEPCLMRRWNKKAEPVFVDGRLSIWEEDA